MPMNADSGRNILVVDDEEEIKLLLARCFRDRYCVFTARNAQEGLRILGEHSIQVVISDQRMPDMTGTELLKKVWHEYPDAIRILLTGYADIEAVSAAINECNIFRYITKPWVLSELNHIVKMAFEQYDLVVSHRTLQRKLEEANEHLESRIRERTAELEQKNLQLEIEITERRKAGEKITSLLAEREQFLTHLESIVSERTAELESANRQLQNENTERMQVEKALRESEERYRVVVDHTYDWGYWKDPEGGILYMSPSCERVSGYSREEFIADKYLMNEIVHPDDRALFEAHQISFSHQSRSDIGDCEFRIITRNGQVRWLHHLCQPVYNDERLFMGRRISIRDITDRKHAEEELYSSQTMLQLVLDTIPQRIFWKDRDSIYLGCNKFFAADAQIESPDDIIGKNDFDLVWKDYAHLYRDDDNAVMEVDVARFNYEEPLIRADSNSVWIRTSKVPLHDMDGSVIGILGAYEDITERKCAEKMLITAHAELEKHVKSLETTSVELRMALEEKNHEIAERRKAEQELHHLTSLLESIREEERASMAREIHDELGQNLTAMKFELSILRKGLPEDCGSSFERLGEMNALVESTIETVKRISSDLRPRILDDLGLISAIKWQSEEFEKRTGIICSCEFLPEDFIVSGTLSTTVFRICQEALTNIARHSKASKAEIKIRKCKDRLEITICDDGVGISRAANNNPASMGIPGMKERAHLLKGKVTIKGAANKGTTVHVRIPLIEKGTKER